MIQKPNRLLVAAQGEIRDPATPQIDMNSSRTHQHDSHEQAQLLLRNFFDSLFELQDVFGQDLITVQDATAKYPILAKTSSSCPFTYDKVPQKQTQCYTPIITIYDRISNSLEEFNEQPIPLPVVLLLSGLDTPNEMDLIGPSSIYTTLKLLLDCAYCESLSPWVPHNKTDEAMLCRERLRDQGIDDSIRKWTARLAVTRKIVAIPIADVSSFYHRLVTEFSDESVVDTQQYENAACDFPYPMHWRESGNEEASSRCMTTYPAQIFNELFQSHSFQLGVAFHGSISNSVGRIEIPTSVESIHDERATREIGSALSSFGAAKDAVQYEVSTINMNATYGCSGSTMESWAFTAGLSSVGSEMGGQLRLEQCSCNGGAGGYPPERTGTYDSLALRSLIVRVVAPEESTSVDVVCLPGFGLNNNECGDGNVNQYHVFDSSSLTTKIRMTLIAADLVQPWATVHSIGGLEIRDDIVPRSPRLAETCTHTKSMRLPESSSTNNVTVTWTVGGAFNVDETAILYGEWSKLDKKIFNCAARPTKSELDAFFSILRDFEEMEGESEEQMETEVTFTPIQSGSTRWHISQRNADTFIPPETTFSVMLDLSRYKIGDRIAIYALGRVDQNWLHAQDETSSDNLPPQSHLVNARTNPEWIIYQSGFDSADRSMIKGQLDFFSVPVTIEIEDRPGFFEASDIIESSIRLTDTAIIEEEEISNVIILYAICMAVATIIVVFLCTFCREQSDGSDIWSVLRARRKIMHVS